MYDGSWAYSYRYLDDLLVLMILVGETNLQVDNHDTT